MTNATIDSPTIAPKTPESSMAKEEPPVLFPTSYLSRRGRVDQSDLFWNGPIHHLLIPTLSPSRSTRDDDTEDDSSVESLASFAPQVSLMPRLSPAVRNNEINSYFLELIPMPNSPPTPKDKNIPSLSKCFNESFTTLESTWCLSDPGKQSYDDWDNDDASLDYSIDEEVQELTSEPSLVSYRLCPARPTPRKGFDADFSATIPKHIVVPEDS
jgi:hypothetical protein